MFGWRTHKTSLAAHDRDTMQRETEARRSERLVSYAPPLRVAEQFDRLLRDYALWSAILTQTQGGGGPNPLDMAHELTAEFDAVVTPARLVATGSTRAALDAVRSAMAEVGLLHAAGVELADFYVKHPGTADRLLASKGQLSEAMARDLGPSTSDAPTAPR